jgi:endonuclease-3
LEKLFGRPSWRRKDPLDELIVTILSQNTNDANRDRAYRRLRERYSSWEAIVGAPVQDVEEAIRPAGLSKQKSVRIQDVLRWIKVTFGEYDLSRLREVGDDEAIALLTSQVGIGIKTAAVVLAFAFDRDLCPVDTHVHRIAQRLGWVRDGTSAEKVFHQIRPMMPVGNAASFHLNLLKFGRTICTARRPKCHECPFREDCPYFTKQTGEK